MKIHHLKIKNLASLKGEHVIDFSPFSSAPLFAITGETGAGKSTLLNAISLALYGKIYKKGLYQPDLVTLGEKEGGVELVFSTNLQLYEAHWKSIVRKKSGELLSTPRIDRFLYRQENGKMVLQEMSAETALKLSFDQFTKCIILNQGEFARFLSSPFSERKEILEKIYPILSLEHLALKSKERWQSHQHELQQLEIKLHDLGPDSYDHLSSLQNDILKLKETLASQEQKNKEIKITHESLIKLLELGKKSLHLNQRIKELTVQLDSSHSEWQIEDEKRKNLLSQKEKFSLFIDEKKPSLLKAKESFIKLQLHEKDLSQKVNSLEKENSDHQKMTTQGLNLDEKILLHQKKREELTQSFEVQGDKPLPTLTSVLEFEKMDQHFHSKNEQLNHLLISLKDCEKQGLESTAQLQLFEEKKITILKEFKLQQAHEVENHYQHYKKYLQTEEFNKKQIQTIELKMSSLEHELSDKKKTIEKISQNLKTIQEQLLKRRQHLSHHEWLIHLMRIKEEVVKQNLKDCPLCHSSLLNKTFTNEDEHQSKIHQDLSVIKAELEQFQTEESSQLSLQLVLNESIHQKSLEMDSLKNELSVFKIKSLDPFSSYEPQKIESLYWEWNKINAESSHWIKRQTDLRAEYAKKLVMVQGLQKELSIEHNNLLSHPLFSLKDQLDEIRNDLQLTQEIKLLDLTLENLKQQRDSTHKTLADSSTLILNLKQSILDLEELIKTLKLSLYPEFLEFSPDEQLKDLDQKFKQQLYAIDLQLVTLRQKEGFYHDIKTKLAALKDQKNDIDFAWAQTKHPLNQIPTELESSTLLIIEALLNQNKILINQSQLSMDDIRNNLGKLSQKEIYIHESLKLKESLEKKLLMQKSASERSKALYDLIGKDELRHFILTLVENALITQTNQELSKLCQGRYEIVQEKNLNRGSSEFLVRDFYKDGLLRKFSTLSGGETFMLSLSMAIGLSEMTKGQAAIESLIIDEGFGTLDEEALDEVLEMLLSIHERGQQIGIISHVKSLTNQIPVNIHLQKNASGESKISLRLP
jgi:exonuclease SbcC